MSRVAPLKTEAQDTCCEEQCETWTNGEWPLAEGTMRPSAHKKHSPTPRPALAEHASPEKTGDLIVYDSLVDNQKLAHKVPTRQAVPVTVQGGDGLLIKIPTAYRTSPDIIPREVYRVDDTVPRPCIDQFRGICRGHESI